MAFIKLVVFGFVGLGIIYLSVSVYSRSVRRDKLEDAYDENPVAGITPEDYVNQGVEAYNKSFRPKLIGLVFVVPPLIVATIVYLINVN